MSMTRRSPSPLVTMRHLLELTDDTGILEHAKGAVPDFEHGYCTDDNARLLVVASRDMRMSYSSITLAHTAMAFLLDALQTNGKIRNRKDINRIWRDQPSTDDCWGRAMWAFGTAVSYNDSGILHDQGLDGFTTGALQRSHSLRATCFAVLGAAEVLKTYPNNKAALEVMYDAHCMLWSYGAFNDPWRWPEERLTYANAVIPDAMIAVGTELRSATMLNRGLTALRWLMEIETHQDRLSVTPTTGRDSQSLEPAFDQQPIEVSTIADACARALSVTMDRQWNDFIDMAVMWFLGHNDGNQLMVDPVSHGGFDGLTAGGVNTNQGAESTLAMLSTLQYMSPGRV